MYQSTLFIVKNFLKNAWSGFEDALFPGPNCPTGSEEFFRKPLIHTFKANSLRKIKKNKTKQN